MQKILITGAAGFIGFHLAKKLKENGIFVIGYDNFNSYYDPLLKRKREKYLQNEQVTIIQGNITDTQKIKNTLEKHEITHCVHLAAQAGVRYSLSHPHSYIESNLQGFVSVLEALKINPKIKFIFASSSSVYGLNKKIPFAIEDPTDHPSNLYGATKKANETIAFTYHHLYNIPMAGLRFFTVYGPWGRPDMAYYSFTKNILENRPIQIFNHGKMKRDFTYIDDIVDGIIAAINYCRGYELFNLGNNQPISLMDFLSLLENFLQKEAIKEFLPLQPGEVLQTYADISKSSRLLGFTPKTPIETGLKNFVDWYLTFTSSQASLSL